MQPFTSAEDTDEVAEDEKQSGNEPEFFSSLSEAHPEAAHDPIELKEEDKENGLVSPQRNVFASRSPSKKPRFNLNATKPPEVKSRYCYNVFVSLIFIIQLFSSPEHEVLKVSYI